jgi:2-methylcitrate dehydratase PrpD
MSNNKDACHYLARLTHQIGGTRFAADDRLLVRQHLLDALAAAFIGGRGKAFDDLIRLCPRVPDGCGWPGSDGERIHPLDAGMAWAFAIHGSVFEDGSREGACHPAAAVVPPLIALGRGKDWQTLDRAAIAGFDVMVRLARTGNPAFTRKGFHPTSITAPFGAAATASVLLGLDLLQTQSALCLAAMGCGGLMASFKSGETEPLQVGWSVRNGLMAAVMADAGHVGYPRMIEEGFYNAYLGSDVAVPIDQALEYEYAIRCCYLKPYPGCRHVHPSIDALAQILEADELLPAQIKKIGVKTYRVAVETEIHSLDSRGDAYFSIPYALAARLVLGTSDWDAFDERHFSNPAMIETMKKVELLVDPEVESLYPRQRGAMVEVHSVDGSVRSAKVTFPLGEPENPLPVSVTRAKFRLASRGLLSESEMDRVESVLNLDSPPGALDAVLDSALANVEAGRK